MRQVFLLACTLTVAVSVTAACSLRRAPPVSPSIPPDVPPAGSDGAGSAPEPLRVGVQAPLTGPYAYDGTALMRAVRLVAEDWNRSAEAGGRRIELIEEDDRGSPAEATATARRLVARRVQAVIGSYPSPATWAVQRIYADAGVIQITPSSPAAELTTRGIPTFFRLGPDVETLARLALAHLTAGSGRRIALIHADTADARDVASRVQDLLTAAGRQVVQVVSQEPEGDLHVPLARLRDAAPEAIFFAGPFRQAGTLLEQAQGAGLAARLVVAGTGDRAGLPHVRGVARGSASAPAPLILSTPLPTEATTAVLAVADFAHRYRERYGQAPDSPVTLLAADSLLVLARASEETGSTEPSRMARYFHDRPSDFPGLSGPVRFEPDGDRADPPLRTYTPEPGGTLVPAAG